MFTSAGFFNPGLTFFVIFSDKLRHFGLSEKRSVLLFVNVYRRFSKTRLIPRLCPPPSFATVMPEPAADGPEK
jgi:hypothetical protein